jgi:hypothetical protein
VCELHEQGLGTSLYRVETSATISSLSGVFIEEARIA